MCDQEEVGEGSETIPQGSTLVPSGTLGSAPHPNVFQLDWDYDVGEDIVHAFSTSLVLSSVLSWYVVGNQRLRVTNWSSVRIRPAEHYLKIEHEYARFSFYLGNF